MEEYAATHRTLRPEPLMAAAVFALIAVLYYPTIAQIVQICWDDEDYSHGLILPFISAYLLWVKRDSIRARFAEPYTPSFSFAGLMLLLFGSVFYLVGRITGILFADWLSFFPTVAGTLLLLFGGKRAVPFIAPLLLLFMAKPIPDSLVPKLFFPLQVFAARVSAWVLEALNVPVYLLGNIIEIPGMRLMVEEACSGIRSMMALLSVAVIVMLLINMRTWSKWLILGISILTAIALNVLRVAITGVLAYFYDPAAATGFFHTFSGMIVFIAGLAIVYGFASLLALPEQKAAA